MKNIPANFNKDFQDYNLPGYTTYSRITVWTNDNGNFEARENHLVEDTETMLTKSPGATSIEALEKIVGGSSFVPLDVALSLRTESEIAKEYHLQKANSEEYTDEHTDNHSDGR